jgi:gas vesicle protein
MTETAAIGCAVVNTYVSGRPRKVLLEEHRNMSTQQKNREYGFAIGLLTGTALGVGLIAWFAPRLAQEVRERVAGSARRMGRRAYEEYQEATTRVGEAVDDLARNGQAAGDGVAGAVARGAHGVERPATAKSDRVPDVRKHVAADRSTSKPAAR